MFKLSVWLLCDSAGLAQVRAELASLQSENYNKDRGAGQRIGILFNLGRGRQSSLC